MGAQQYLVLLVHDTAIIIPTLMFTASIPSPPAPLPNTHLGRLVKQAALVRLKGLPVQARPEQHLRRQRPGGMEAHGPLQCQQQLLPRLLQALGPAQPGQLLLWLVWGLGIHNRSDPAWQAVVC